MNIIALCQVNLQIPSTVTTGVDVVEALSLPPNADWTKLAWPLCSVYVPPADLANMAYLPYLSYSWQGVAASNAYLTGVGGILNDINVWYNITTPPAFHANYNVYFNLVFADEFMPPVQNVAYTA